MKNPINRDMILDGGGGSSNTNTKFEQRIYLALERKKDLDKKKAKLLKKMGQNQEEAKSKFDKQLAKFKELRKTSGYDSFINDLTDERYKEHKCKTQ